MTMPRQILPHTTYLVTRRCTQGQFLLRPDKTVNQVFLYCLAYAAQKYRVQIHAYCVMSNHWHAVVTDSQGTIPEFLEWVHKHVAKCLNIHWKRSENIWSTQQTSLIPLHTSEDVLNKIAYVLANPVRAGLVRKLKQWPGLYSELRSGLGKACTVKRPKILFRVNGVMPEEVQLVLTAPVLCGEYSDGMFVRGVFDRVRELQAQLKKTGIQGKILGAKAVLRQNPFSRPNHRFSTGHHNPRSCVSEIDST